MGSVEKSHIFSSVNEWEPCFGVMFFSTVRAGDDTSPMEVADHGAVPSGVIPLSVEMLIDSDDEVDRKPPPMPATRPGPRIVTSCSRGTHHTVAPTSGVADRQSKLLLLQMASEFVEAQSQTAGACTTSLSIVSRHYHHHLLS